jgi:tetratricopeptide (TPR) repeat protein
MDRLSSVEAGNSGDRLIISKLVAAIGNLLSAHGRLLTVAKIQPGVSVCFADEINAYVMGNDAPIIVTSALLIKYGQDSEFLAAVLAHEMGHLQRAHFDYQANALKIYEAHARSLAEHEFYRTGNVRHAISVGKKTLSWNMNAFGRAQELDADDFGTQLLAQAGYRPDIVVKMMLRFLADDGYQRTDWFKNHPGWPERLANVEPRILDLELTAALERLSAASGEAAGIVRHVNLWIEKLPNSGNAWYWKARLLEQLRRTSYVEAYERAIAGRQPTISLDETKVDLVWLELCTGLYQNGNRLESAYCARNIRTAELREYFRASTFGERLWQNGDGMPSTLLSARDENGGKFITNQQSSVVFRGLKAQTIEPWRPIRFPPTDADAPIRLQ